MSFLQDVWKEGPKTRIWMIGCPLFFVWIQMCSIYARFGEGLSSCVGIGRCFAIFSEDIVVSILWPLSVIFWSFAWLFDKFPGFCPARFV